MRSLVTIFSFLGLVVYHRRGINLHHQASKQKGHPIVGATRVKHRPGTGTIQDCTGDQDVMQSPDSQRDVAAQTEGPPHQDDKGAQGKGPPHPLLIEIEQRHDSHRQHDQQSNDDQHVGDGYSVFLCHTHRCIRECR